MKTIIAGCRSVDTYETVLAAIESSGFNISEVVSGAARGVDQLGEQWAEANGIALKRFPAEWGRYGRGAGPVRNGQMADYADALIAIWDGKTSGTKNMIQQARKKDLQVYVHRIERR